MQLRCRGLALHQVSLEAARELLVLLGCYRIAAWDFKPLKQALVLSFDPLAGVVPARQVSQYLQEEMP